MMAASASATASAVFSNITASSLVSPLLNFRSIGSYRNSLTTAMTTLGRLAFLSELRAAAASPPAFVETKPPEVTVDEVGTSIGTGQSLLACPICFELLALADSSRSSVDPVSEPRWACKTCNKAYGGTESHLDLTVASGTKVYGEALAISTEFFRIPLISFLYERGWRQSFSVWGGFPGPEKEWQSSGHCLCAVLLSIPHAATSYISKSISGDDLLSDSNLKLVVCMQFDLMKGFVKPVLGENIVDASCGSGLFSRLFAKSGLFSLVIALDYSESMLKQCYDFAHQDENFPKEKLLLVRADISRLPFASRSIDAVHAGAALHCWPSPSTAVAEINRVLRPGGVFVATTYLLDGPFALIPLLRPLRQNIVQLSGSHIFLAERELEDLCRACGFVNFRCVRNGRFVMISATKPR